MNPTSDGSDALAEDDPRLLAAVQDYHRELEAGRRPDRRALAARFPDLADALAPYLDALDLVHAGAPLLDHPSADRPALTSAPELPAEPLGDFRIVRELGRGGMGVVYEAVQLSLGRRVALKVLPFAAALDARQLRRFQNEAQAAAQLHHTNIVPVHYVGCERGVHFYAMQLIEGQNLAALVEDLRRQTAPGDLTGPDPTARPRPGAETRSDLAAQLSTQRTQRVTDFFRTVARLVAQAAEALDYAHGQGIVHRDVKPANLLVDGRGTVWVTDFGLAHFHADAALTQTGDLVGTLRYMSPEQAAGQRAVVDQRTDVYSLGATLYELLTLRPIFDGTDRQTLLRQILHEEPRPPRAVDRTVPEELETIVLKAVSKSPADRYATARDFADDLHRFLRHEPIRARRATAAQRARKWLRRHPSVMVGAGIFLVLLTAGSLVSAWLIRGEQEKTRRAYEREQHRAREAETQFRLARRAVDKVIELAEDELADKAHLEGPRKRLLEAALEYYQEFLEQPRDDPDARADLEATRDRVKRILADLAVLQGAGQHFLLGHAAVLDDLGLSQEQRDRVAELTQRLADQRQETFREFHRLGSEERRQRFVELARANETAVAAILTPAQLRRLRQLALQFQGPAAFRESDVVSALRLTAQQRDRIRAVEAESFMVRFEQHRPGHSTRTMTRKPNEDAQKGAMARIQALLTPEQVRQWKEMTGEPFRGPMPPFIPGQPRPFGPPGPR